MNALFIANLELKETEGIYKKICAQSDAVEKVVGHCNLITRRGDKAVLKEYLENKQEELNNDFFDYISQQILSAEMDLIYVRHMIPNFRLISVLKNAKNQGVKIFYEIPTYPYFGEQFKASRKKYRAVVKIGLDLIFWPLIYHYIDKLVIIRSNSKSHHFKKMIEITNGVKTEDIKSKDYSGVNYKKVFSMVTVGTLYPYHGYDRVLEGLAACNERVEGVTVEFHIVGSSQTIDELHAMADKLKLHHVIFHGTKTTEELNCMYDSFDVGLGCLALHRRNADIDTTLKVIEYLCRGVPVVTSGQTPLKHFNNCTIKVIDNDYPLSIEDIFSKYNKISLEVKKSISELAKSKFSWISIMRKALEE